jgi:sugar phosphate isomerase/epimerase
MSYQPYSVQLYSVREAMESDLPTTVRRIAEIGYTQVEPYNFAQRVEELDTALRENGLTAPTGHAPLLSTDQDAVFAAANRLGITTVIDPYLPAAHWQDAESIIATAARLNAAAKRGADYGVRVGYHNHAWEISSKIAGTTALEFFADQLDPELVLEVDTYFVAVGGEDPVQFLPRLGERVIAVHLKDGPVTDNPAEQLPVGQGRIDVWGVLAAAASLEVPVVELEDYAGDRFDGLADSLRFLEAGQGSR